MSGCPYCEPSADRILAEGRLALALWGAEPAVSGHALLVPRRHVGDWFELSPEERADLSELTLAVRRRLAASGLTVTLSTAAHPHLCVHVLPSYGAAPRLGDAPHPLPLVRGGEDPLLPCPSSFEAGSGPAPALPGLGTS